MSNMNTGGQDKLVKELGHYSRKRVLTGSCGGSLVSIQHSALLFTLAFGYISLYIIFQTPVHWCYIVAINSLRS